MTRIMKNKLVSIVLLNWYGQIYIHQCIESIERQTYREFEVILVDNASTDGSLARIEKESKGFKIVKNDKNYGYAKGMNIGISLSKGEYVLPLNYDVYLKEDFIEQCVKCIEKEGRLGAVSGREYSWLYPSIEIIADQPVPSLIFLRRSFKGLHKQDKNEERLVFGPRGSFPFLRKSMLEDVKRNSGDYYDEEFETGWEDKDLWFRMQLRGWKCMFSPSICAFHVGSASVDEKPTFFTKSKEYKMRILRNRYYTIFKNISLRDLLWLSPYLIIAEMGMIAYFSIRTPRTLIALMHAWMAVIKKKQYILAKRMRIQQNIKVEAGYLRQFFRKF